MASAQAIKEREIHGRIKMGRIASHRALWAVVRSAFYSRFSGKLLRNFKHKSSFLKFTFHYYSYFVVCGSEEEEGEGVETK